jgi:DHA1 family tetracycline resistance protein-like MFS transporter
MTEETTIKPGLFPVLLVTFINMLGMSVVLPFLVIIVLSMGGNEYMYGLLGAMYSIFQLIGAPVLGNWSDNIGRKKILLLSSMGTFIGWLIFIAGLLVPSKTTATLHINGPMVFSIPLVLIFFARALDGLTGGSISVANAYVADISKKEERKKNFGKISAASNLGLIFGPLLAGLLGATKLGNLLPVIATALISLAAIFVIYFYVHESRIIKVNANTMTQPEPQLKKKGRSIKLPLYRIFSIPMVPYFLLLYFLIFLAFNFFYVAFPVYAAGELKWTVLQLGVFFSFLSGALVIVQGPVLSFLGKKFSGANLVIAGGLFLAICFICLAYNNIVIMYTGALFFALGNGIMWPSFVALLSNTGDENTQGSIQGTASSAGSLASIIGLVSGAFIYDILRGNIFFVTAAFMAFISLISIPLIKIEKKL